jgi:MFS transporter, DHA1 family, tetracycline resistance protein
LAATAALTQSRVGRARDAGRLPDHTGIAIGLLLCASGIAIAALLPGTASLVCSSLIVGAGTGLITPLAFAYLSRTSPPERVQQTTGAAEIGRELGDAGGPLIVGVIAAVTTLSTGLLAVTVALAALANLLAVSGRSSHRLDDSPPDRDLTED